ncbi:transmembrane signal receptor [Lithospermum erythrorhizon]|uniref:Transmembrane signal receptor n=1 Tax=Lithospermum erythrorhizon TaxID=34254 RepID=A0AAV3P2C9_LITER
MTGDYGHLFNCSELTPQFVNLLDGVQTSAVKQGSVKLSSSLTLHNVLYDRISRKVIGLGEIRNGVYIFRSVPVMSVSPVVVHASVSYSSVLLHQRLGHPSSATLSLFNHSSTTSHLPPEGNYDFAFDDEFVSQDRGRNPIDQVAPTSVSNEPVLDHETMQSAPNSATPLDEPPIDNKAFPAALGQRCRRPPSYLSDYIFHSARVIHLISSLTPPSPFSGIWFLITNYVSYNNFSVKYCSFLANVTSTIEPKTYKEVVKDQCWHKAMQVEIDALEKNHTWDIVALPRDKRAIGCQWREDFKETFALIAKMVSVRTFLAIVVAKNWEVHQLDVNNTFLHDEFMQDFRQTHYDAAIQVLHYLKAHPGQGVFLRDDSDLQVYAYCDFDWVSCPTSRRSVSAYFIMLGSSPVSWKMKKQTTISRSSAETEYRAMAFCCAELKWLKCFLSYLGVFHTQPIRLFCDNQVALHIASNPVFHELTKHTYIDCHFIREMLVNGDIITVHVSTHHQLADLFTKALGAPQFSNLLAKLGIRDPHAPP